MKDWKVLPLSGKYYGTKVETEHGIIGVWLSNHRAEPFASVREIADGWTPEDGHDHVEDENSYRAACLIAAAPELLEALENAVSQMEMASYCVENGGYDEALLHLNALMSGKRAAIAKARGEA